MRWRAPLTAILTFAVPDSDSPCAASCRVKSENGTAPSNFRLSCGVASVETVPPPLIDRPAALPILASKVSRRDAKVPLDLTDTGPIPTLLVCAVSAAAQSIAYLTVGFAAAPVNLTVPEIVPAALRLAANALASEAGMRVSVPLRSSVEPAVPEMTAVPLPSPNVSLSSVTRPPAIPRVEPRCSTARMPCAVPSADASSTVTVPPAALRRPAAFNGMALTSAPPEKRVHSLSRSSLRSTRRTTVVPDFTSPARTVPDIPGALI